MSLPVFSIVLPSYNEEEVIPKSSQVLLEALDALIADRKVDESSFLLFVDDGSKDKTWEKITQAYIKDSRAKGLKLAGNVGHQNALLSGLLFAKEKSDVVLSMDVDLQDDPAAIPAFLEKYAEGYDVVYGVRRERKFDTFFKKSTALLFYRLMSVMGVNLVYNHADCRLTSKQVLDGLEQFKEVNLFLRGLFPVIGFKSTEVYYDRADRFAGETKYPLRKMLSFAFDGITSFSVKPLRAITSIGVMVFIFSLFMGAKALYSWAIGDVVPGWTSLIIAIYFLGALQLLSIGILGEYLGKIYKEVKARPRFIQEEILF